MGMGASEVIGLVPTLCIQLATNKDVLITVHENFLPFMDWSTFHSEV